MEELKKELGKMDELIEQMKLMNERMERHQWRIDFTSEYQARQQWYTGFIDEDIAKAQKPPSRLYGNHFLNKINKWFQLLLVNTLADRWWASKWKSSVYNLHIDNLLHGLLQCSCHGRCQSHLLKYLGSGSFHREYEQTLSKKRLPEWKLFSFCSHGLPTFPCEARIGVW